MSKVADLSNRDVFKPLEAAKILVVYGSTVVIPDADPLVQLAVISLAMAAVAAFQKHALTKWLTPNGLDDG